MNEIKYRNALAETIWNASRADEGTISATGANIVADALIASPVLAQMKREWQEEAWDEGRRARPQYLGPDNGHYNDECMGWNDCYCGTYTNPYRAKAACPCGHPADDHDNGACMHLCDCAWPSDE